MLYNIYFSPTGGTKKVADILAGNLGGEVCVVDICRDIEKMILQAEDVCLVSVPSFAGRVPQIAVERLKKISGNGAKAVLNCVYGNREWDDTLTELQDTLESCGFVCVAAVAAVAEYSIFRQFAAGRPDCDDAKELAEFASKISAKLESGVFGDLTLPEIMAHTRNFPTFLSSPKPTMLAINAEFVLPVVRWAQSTKPIPAKPIKTAVSVVCAVGTFVPNTPATSIRLSCKPPPKKWLRHLAVTRKIICLCEEWKFHAE